MLSLLYAQIIVNNGCDLWFKAPKTEYFNIIVRCAKSLILKTRNPNKTRFY